MRRAPCTLGLGGWCHVSSSEVCLELIMSFGELTGRTDCPFSSHFHRSQLVS